MQRILIPVDFSDYATKAALFAAEIAALNQSTLYYLHAMELGIERIYQPLTDDNRYLTIAEERQSALEEFRDGIKKVYPNIKTELLLESGTAVDSILETCRMQQIDLVVMGTRGAGKIKQVLVGSTAAGVVAGSVIPVLVVPSGYAIEKPDGILFATNHFEEDEGVLSMIITLARLFSATIHAVVFVDTDKAEAYDYLENTRKMDHYKNWLNKKYPDISFHCELAEGEHFENAIELYQVRHDTDMVAMITYPRGFWQKLLQKSATRKMIFHSAIPILAIPARK